MFMPAKPIRSSGIINGGWTIARSDGEPACACRIDHRASRRSEIRGSSSQRHNSEMSCRPSCGILALRASVLTAMVISDAVNCRMTTIRTRARSGCSTLASAPSTGGGSMARRIMACICDKERMDDKFNFPCSYTRSGAMADAAAAIDSQVFYRGTRRILATCS